MIASVSKAKLLDIEVTFSQQPFLRPLILSTGSIETLTQADATVRVEVNGSVSQGRSCIYLSDLWAWPDPNYTHAQRDQAMQDYCILLAEEVLPGMAEPAHPLVTGLRLHEYAVEHEPAIASAIPPALARCVCASIFDAAIHDAVGRAAGCSAFDLYDDDFAVPQADMFFFGPGSTVAAIRNLLKDPPRDTSPVWWLGGKADDLEADVRPAAERLGLFAFKIKIMGQDPQEDASRVVEVVQAAQRWGIDKPRISVDTNEANPDAQSVMDFLDVLAELSTAAYDALEMVEQPTGRDIERHTFDWSAVSARKPVMVDEGLMTLQSMVLAEQQHWSGFALKTCKGHSFALVAAAWAHEHGMKLSLQDLTNPGLSAIHAALFAARVPTMNGVELNSPQFTPAANEACVHQYPRLFEVQNGVHELPAADTLGLGGALRA